jgi:hypothetical protein
MNGRVLCGLAFALLLAGGAAAQEAPPRWPSPLPITVQQPAPPPLPPPEIVVLQPQIEIDGRLDTLRGAPAVAPGQQHWVALNLIAGQPSAGRVAVKVWPRENNSLWLEAYGGSALFDAMYGFGARVQHTAWANDRGSRVMVSPGLGVNVFPDWWYGDDPYRGRHGHWHYGRTGYSTLTYLVGDVDVSWLYDFTPHCGFELGLKAGIAGRLGGHVGDDYPGGVMWGKNVYPVLAVYSGLRF